MCERTLCSKCSKTGDDKKKTVGVGIPLLIINSFTILYYTILYFLRNKVRFETIVLSGHVHL